MEKEEDANLLPPGFIPAGRGRSESCLADGEGGSSPSRGVSPLGQVNLECLAGDEDASREAPLPDEAIPVPSPMTNVSVITRSGRVLQDQGSEPPSQVDIPPKSPTRRTAPTQLKVQPKTTTEPRMSPRLAAPDLRSCSKQSVDASGDHPGVLPSAVVLPGLQHRPEGASTPPDTEQGSGQESGLEAQKAPPLRNCPPHPKPTYQTPLTGPQRRSTQAQGSQTVNQKFHPRTTPWSGSLALTRHWGPTKPTQPGQPLP
jgi:hypothetical protein